MSRPIEETFTAFAQALNELDLPFVIVGGFAVSAWGAPRSTQAVDVLLEYEEKDVHKLAQVLEERALAVEPHDLRASLKDGSHVTVIDEQSIYHVDLKPVREGDERASLEHARRVTVHGLEVPISSPEDTIAHKLLFGSPQDIEDAESILLRQQDNLDRRLLQERCRALGVSDLLDDLETVIY